MQLAIAPAVGETFLFHHGPGLVNGERAAIKLGAIELGDRLVRIFRTHGNESESLGSSSIAIRDNAHGLNRSNLRKQTVKVFLSCLKREISNVNFLCHALS